MGNTQYMSHIFLKEFTYKHYDMYYDVRDKQNGQRMLVSPSVGIDNVVLCWGNHFFIFFHTVNP